MGNLGSWPYVDGRERGAKRPMVYGDRARRRWSISSVTSSNNEEGTISAIGADNVRDVNRETARFSPEYKRFVLSIAGEVMLMINHFPRNIKNWSHILKLDDLYCLIE